MPFSGSLYHVRMSLNQMEILGERRPVPLALLERMKHQRILDLPLSAHKESDLRDLMDLMNIPLRLYGPCQLDHRLLPHPVAKVVSLAPLQDGRQQLVLPVVIVSKTAQRSLDTADDDRHIRIKIL